MTGGWFPMSQTLISELQPWLWPQLPFGVLCRSGLGSPSLCWLSQAESELRCRVPGGKLCSGRGRCECGVCICQVTESGKYYGPLCECHNWVCEIYDGKICAGKQTVVVTVAWKVKTLYYNQKYVGNTAHWCSRDMIMYVSLNHDCRTELRVCPRISPDYRIKVKGTVSIIKWDFARPSFICSRGKSRNCFGLEALQTGLNLVLDKTLLAFF